MPERRTSITRAVLSVLLLIAIVVTVAVVLKVVPLPNSFQRAGGNNDGSDDRPPIIVRDGSLIIDGGDPADPSPIVDHWANWKQDLLSDEWKPDLPSGKHVNSFTVTVTDPSSVKACAPMTGGHTVVIEFRDGNKVVNTVLFHIHENSHSHRLEPKVKSDQPLETSALVTGPPPVPATLMFGQKDTGWISAVKVDTTTCNLTPPATTEARKAVRVRIDPVH